MPFTFYPSQGKVNKISNRCCSVDVLNRFISKDEELGVDILRSSPVRLTVGDGLVGVVQDAYNRHHCLVLRPDDFWIAILVQFRNYLDHHHHVGDGNKEEIGKDMLEWIRSDFTTTSEIDKVVSIATLMSVHPQQFDDNSCMLLGGLPEVTILGEAFDYRELQDKVLQLLEYDVGDGLIKGWVNLLLPIIYELKCSVEGRVNLDFWNNICHCGDLGLNGWITVFGDKGGWVDSNSKILLKGLIYPVDNVC